MDELYVYIHIPFCKSKCSYCDFLSFEENDVMKGLYSKYVDAVIKDITLNSKPFKNSIVKTIFFGGGTPTILSSNHIEAILNTIKSSFNLDRNIEITLEANPDTVDLQKLEDYYSYGINRLSFGVQTLNNRLLKRISRVHSVEKFIESYNLAQEVGFNNINLDLMYALPDQSLQDFKDTIISAVDLNPQHISCYSLIIQQGSKIYEEKNFVQTDEELEIQMYEFAKKYLENNDYKQYEISNYSKLGFESKHNLSYWSNKNYLGFGLDASSYINGKIRFYKTRNLKDYIKFDFEPKFLDELSLRDRYAEYMFLGLRKIEGISEQEFKNIFGVTIFEVYGRELNKHFSNGMLKRENGRIFLSEQGIYVSNEIFSDFIL